MIHDISMTISEDMQVYKNKPEKKPSFSIASDLETGSSFETNLMINLHTGTHIDFGKHVSKDGSVSDSFDPESCLGTAIVVDVTNVMDGVTKADLEGKGILKNDFVLLKTKNSYSESFIPDFTFLSLNGANYLHGVGVRGVGTDGLGIERSQPGHPTHHTLLDNGIHILEGLRLKDVPEGRYELLCLPIKIAGVEALPARVYLRSY